MPSDTAQEAPSGPRKAIRVNSITDPSLKRIRKPCEARAGHGAIGMLIALTVFAIVVAVLVKAAMWLWRWITGP